MNIIVKHNDDGKHGIFESFDVQGNRAGSITYTWAGADKFIADHTDVEDAFGGQGVGMIMFESMVAFARDKGVKVIPLCPYIKSRFAKYTEYNDILQ